MRWRGFVAGVFGLVVLQVLVANPNAYGAVGGVTTGIASGVQYFLDPNRPAIPDRSNPLAKTSAATSSTAPPAQQYLPKYTGPASVVPGEQ